jgi:succinyl-CoA synthetase beta subunit
MPGPPFLALPAVPHDDEYYLCIQSDRLGYTISFSEFGGMDIEENWDKASVRVGGPQEWVHSAVKACQLDRLVHSLVREARHRQREL